MNYGVLVSKVEMYSEAMNQGLTEGDVILSVNRKEVNSPDELRKMVDNSGRGDALLLLVKRKNGSTSLVAVEVAK